MPDGAAPASTLWLVVAGLILSGCASLGPIDPMTDTTFSLEADGRSFSYVGLAESSYDLKTKEADRLAVLRKWMDMKGACRGGYTTTARREEKRPNGTYDIYYLGQCT